MRALRPSPLHVALPLLLAAAGLPGTLPAPLAAQGPRPVAVGATVRVFAPPPDGWREGRVAALDAERLVLRGPRRGRGAAPALDTIPASAVRLLEMRTGASRGRRALAGAALGALIGTGAAYLAMDDTTPGFYNFVYAVGLPGIGAVIGAISAAATGGQRWVPARLPAPSAPTAHTPPGAP